MATAETQISGFFARYEPAVAKLGKALRAKLRKRLPGLLEIVYLYERQEALVFTYSPTERGIEGLCSLALYPGKVHLAFNRGPQLSKWDPNKLLEGSGTMVRHVVMTKAADFDRADIQALMTAAIGLSRLRLDPGAKGAVILKAEEQKQRAQRAAKAARPASPGRKAKATR